MLSWMNVTRSFSFSSVSTTDACEMPIDASCVSDFTISGKLSRLGRRIGRPIRKTSNSGTGIRWYASSFFDSDLSRASSSPRGLQPVYEQLEQLQVADDVLIEDRDVVESFEQIERDVRLPFLGGAADVAEVVVDAQRPDLVAERPAASR